MGLARGSARGSARGFSPLSKGTPLFDLMNQKIGFEWKSYKILLKPNNDLGSIVNFYRKKTNYAI
jgi:hypothetical protein